MKRKRITAFACVVLLLCLGLCFWYRHRMVNRVIGYQSMQIMVDGVRYVHSGGRAKERPDTPPDGTITKVNEPADYPDADGEANFGAVGMPYWYSEGKIVAEINQVYYVFDPLNHQE